MKKSKKPELPKGLQEFAATLWDAEYSPELLARLADLPESGFTADLAAHDREIEQVANAEKALTIARHKAADTATKIWEYAVKNWTVEELQTATGYTDE